MADENTDVVVQESPSEMRVVDIDFSLGSFGAEPPKQEVIIPTQQKAEEKQVEQAAQEENKLPEVDYSKYLKETFNYDTPELLKADLEKAKTPAEIKFENEASQKLYSLLKEGKEDEVYSFLAEKKALEKLTSVNIDNVDVAAEIIKLGMRKKYADLTDSEIEYRFNKLHGIPLAPKQKIDETDEEYEETLNDWKAQKEAAEKDIIIEAKLTRPELEKLKTELKFPEIQKPATDEDVQKRQEELAAQQKKVDDDFRAKVPDTIKALSGVKIETTVKYGDVELPIDVSYIPNDAERLATQNATENSMEHFANTWLDEQGVPDPNKVASDMFFLQHKTAILQKVASEAGTQAIKEYLNKRANVKLDTGTSNATDLKSDKTDDEMAKFFLRAS